MTSPAQVASPGACTSQHDRSEAAISSFPEQPSGLTLPSIDDHLEVETKPHATPLCDATKDELIQIAWAVLISRWTSETEV
jgi:hypothetical protein